MTKSATVTVRLDPKVKEAAQAVFDQLGLTTTQAVSLFFGQVSIQKGLPFELKIPNAETLRALDDLEVRRNLKTFEDAGDALKYLGLPDA